MAEQTYTLAQLRRDICTELQMPFFRRYGGPLAADGATTTTQLVDADLTQGDDFWAGQWFYHIDTQAAAYINTFLANTDAALLEKAITGLNSGDAYEIHAIWNAYDIHRAINRAIEMDGKAFPETSTDQTMVLGEDQLAYSLAGLAKKVWIPAKIWLERATSVTRGQATAGGASSITDSAVDFTGVTNAFLVSIYHGTGKGQVRNVASLTGIHQINTSVAWTTVPDATSKYAVWNPSKEVYDWFQVRAARWDSKEFPDILYLKSRYPSLYGMRIRIEYMVHPTAIALEADTTIVPKEYVLARACSILHGQAIGDNRFNRDMHYAEHVRYQQRADEILGKYHPHTPDITVWEDQDSQYQDTLDPLGWRAGSGY